jgi:hypothetical protein
MHKSHKRCIDQRTLLLLHRRAPRLFLVDIFGEQLVCGCKNKAHIIELSHSLAMSSLSDNHRRRARMNILNI